MTQPLKEIEAQALQLPVRERSELVDTLLASLEGGTDAPAEEVASAWEDELVRRVAKLESGQTRFVPAEEAFRDLAAHIRSRLP